ncbi:MAG TPA: hypothetical protein VNR70_04155 [Steroidobacteraceae bacterium]|nr:hypothetical protein [Steroidobacteraceae bacterium]
MTNAHKRYIVYAGFNLTSEYTCSTTHISATSVATLAGTSGRGGPAGTGTEAAATGAEAIGAAEGPKTSVASDRILTDAEVSGAVVAAAGYSALETCASCCLR